MSQLSRRDFLSAATLAGAVIGSKLHSDAPLAPSASPAYATTRPSAPFELEEATVAQLQAGMVSGKYISARLTELYLGRVAAMDRQGSALRACHTVTRREINAPPAPSRSNPKPLAGAPAAVRAVRAVPVCRPLSAA